MADRYWVGGTGTWNSTSTTNWAASSGGGTGASVPTAADNVFFDANSNVGTGAFTVTMADSPRVCNDITISGLDGAMTLAGTSIGLTVSGSLSFPATNLTRTYTGTTTFNATTTGKTITTNGVAFGGPVTLDGAGGGWTLGSALTLVGTGLAGVLNHIRGTFDTSTSNYNISGVTSFQSNSANTRTLNLNNSTITISGGVSPTWSTIASGLTFNAGQSLIQFSSSSVSMSGGGLTFYDVSFTSTSLFNPRSISGANTYRNLTFAAPGAGAGLIAVFFTNNHTINGTFTASGVDSTRRMVIASNSIGTSSTLTCAAIAATTDVDFRDITIAGAHGTLSGTRLGDCGGNSNITFDAGKTVYWNLTAGGSWSATAWATSSGGTPAATNFPLAQDTVIIENTGLTAGNTITIDADWNIGTLDTSTRTNAMTLASGTTAPTFYGNFTYGSGVTPTGTSSGGYTFSNRATKTLNSGGKTFTQPVTIDAPGGGIQLLTNNLTLGSTLTTTLTQGTLDLNNLTLTTGLFFSGATNTRTIAFGTSQIALTGNAATVLFVTATNLTTTGTPYWNSTYTGATGTRTFNTTATEAQANSLFNVATSGSSGIVIGTAATDTVALTGSFGNVNLTGFTNVLSNTTRTIFGNLTLPTGGTLIAGTSTTTFASTSGTKTITSNGRTMDFPVTFNGIGGTFQLQDAMTVGSIRTTTLTNGALDLFNNTLTTGSFSSSNSNTRTIAFGTGNISCSGTGNVWVASTVTNLTTTGTQVVNVTSVGSTAIGVLIGSTSEANSISFNFTGGTYALSTSAGNYRNLNFTGYAGSLVAISTMSVFGNLTLSTGMSLTASTAIMTFASTSGTRTITSNGKTMDFPVTFDGVGGTWQLQDNMTLGATRTCTLTNGALDLFNNTLSTGIFSSSNSNTRSIAFGTGGITLTTATAGSTVLSMATATNFTFTGTSNISAAMSVTRTFSFGNSGGATISNRLNLNLTSGASTPTFGGSFRQINFTGSTSNAGSQTISCHGFTLATGGTYTLTDFTMVGTGTLTYTGRTIDILNINTAGITTTLADAGINVTTTLTNGILNLAGFTLTNTTSAATATGTKNLTFNGGTFVISGSGASAWNNAAPTGFTTTAGTGTGTISMTAATAKTFVGGGSTYNCTLNQGGAGTLTITGANTFNDITETVPTANQITFPASTTTTVNAFTLSGSSGNLVSIRSSTPGTRFTLSDASGTVSVSFLDIQDSNATGGATWQALTTNGNVNSGNNLGWDFGGITYAVSVSETATGADAITLVLVRVGAVSETATGADTVASQFDAVGSISETATGADQITNIASLQLSLTETATAADTTATQLDAVGAISETATGADTTATTLTRIGAISETATGTDTTASQLTTSGAVSETATGADADTVTLTSVGFVDETATGADDTTNQLDAFGGVDETATAADDLATQLDGVANVDEIAIGVDSPLGNIITTLQINEGATILDAALARLLWELINDNQLPGWQLIQNPQGTGWTVINTNTGTSWTPIGTA